MERLIDTHLAQIAKILSDGTYKRSRRKTKDFLLLPQVRQPPLTGEQMLAKVKAINAALGGEFIDKRGGND